MAAEVGAAGSRQSLCRGWSTWRAPSRNQAAGVTTSCKRQPLWVAGGRMAERGQSGWGRTCGAPGHCRPDTDDMNECSLSSPLSTSDLAHAGSQKVCEVSSLNVFQDQVHQYTCEMLQTAFPSCSTTVLRNILKALGAAGVAQSS